MLLRILWRMEQLLPKSKCSILNSIHECMTFRKCQGAGAPLSIVFPNTFEDVVGDGAVAPGEQCSFFRNIPKYMIFQKR